MQTAIERVLILGSGGAGKSTLARQLGEILALEVIHLDAFYWQPGWIETPQPEWRERVKQLVQRDRWVMDGNYSSTLDLRLDAADTIIFLDFPRLLCLGRVLKRRWQYANTTRPDMAPACPEQLNWEFMQWVWSYPDRSRPKVLARLQKLLPHQQAIVLRSPAEVKQFLEQMKQR